MSAAVKERPILFSGAMVRAILDKRKTQTRRAIKLPPWSTQDWDDFETDGESAAIIASSTGCFAEILSPYGKVGDRLWVRETWLTHQELYFYRATDLGELPDSLLQFSNPPKWKPSIFMPRAASRITLEITGVSIEKLQDITEEDAIAEGIDEFSYEKAGLNYEINGRCTRDPIQAFEFLWDSINGKTMPWKSDPWVRAIEFKQVEVSDDA